VVWWHPSLADAGSINDKSHAKHAKKGPVMLRGSVSKMAIFAMSAGAMMHMAGHYPHLHAHTVRGAAL